MRNFIQGRQEIEHIVKNKDPDIFISVETRLTEKNTIKYPGYTILK